MIGQPIADLEKVTEVPSGSAYIANMGDGSGTKTVPQEILTKEVGRALKVGDLSELQTENKNNLVAAINEAAQSGGGGSAVDILDTKEEIEANTETGKAAGAQAVKEMFGALNDNFGGCSFEQAGDSFYIVGADAVRKKLGSTVNKLLYTNNTLVGGSSISFTIDRDCGNGILVLAVTNNGLVTFSNINVDNGSIKVITSTVNTEGNSLQTLCLVAQISNAPQGAIITVNGKGLYYPVVFILE
ncbi:hypothetical protein AALB47_11330 [Lachnospiraceae bacterium 54-11]